MRSERDTQEPLTPGDVQKILSICSPRGLLVGGQALAFWADHLQVERPANLVSGVTADADFIGDSLLAKDLGKRLGWQTWIPALDDSTPQTGKVTHRTKAGAVKQVDFLSGVVGLTTKDIAREFIRLEVATRGERVGLKLLERIADIAADIAAVRVFLLHGIDPLQAVPLEDFRTTSAL